MLRVHQEADLWLLDAVKSDMTFQIQKQTQKEIEKIAIRILILDIHRKKDEGKLPKGTPEEQYIYYHYAKRNVCTCR